MLGTVTIVFSDVQSSTAQWELYPEAMSEAMEVHNSTVREKILLTGGYEVKTGFISSLSDSQREIHSWLHFHLQ